MPDRSPWPPAEPLSPRAAATPDRTAVIDATDDTAGSQDRWSYRDLNAVVDGVAERLCGLVPNDPPSTRIGLAVSPRVPFIAALYATWRLGWTAVPIDPDATEPELDRRVRRTDPALLICEEGSESRCVSTDGPVASVDDPAADAVASLFGGRLDDVDGDGQLEPGEMTGSGPEDALVLFTSGTTGRPKAVRLTMANLLASAVASAFRLGVTPSDRWLGCLPLHHMGGLAPVVRSVCYGTPLVLQGSFGASRTRKLLETTGVTGVSLVPTQLRRLLEDGWSSPSTVRTVLLGGAPADEALLARAAEAGVPACPTYGLTETASQVATARPTEAAQEPETVGQPLLWTDVTVVADGEPVGPGERGELVVAGPTVTPGYLDADVTEAAFGERGLHTGDLGVRDGNGRLRILERTDDVINTGGELVAPGEVIDVLESHPRVEAAAVVGIDDPEWGERVAALVVPVEDGTPEEDASLGGDTLREHCRAQLSEYKLPKTVVVTDALPRTDSGTIDRDAVAAEIERRRTDDG